MLSIDTTSSDDDTGAREQTATKIVNAIKDCMDMNNLTAEMLLARFFDSLVLSTYSQDVLGRSGKGSAATLAARIAKEWSKDDFQVSGSSKRKRGDENDVNGGGKAHKNSQPEDEGENIEEDDWKRPLFYWKGRLFHDKSKNAIQWSGSWISGLAEDGLPDEEQYEETKEDNAFKLVTVGKLKSSISQEDAQTESGFSSEPKTDSLLQSYVGQCGNFKGKYLLDQGDGLGPRNFRDLSHHFVFDSRIQSSNIVHGGKLIIVVGWGSTEFGNFVSAGYVHVRHANNLDFEELVFARRYIADDDSRQEVIRKGESKSLLEAFEDQDISTFWTNMLPWKSPGLRQKSN